MLDEMLQQKFATIYFEIRKHQNILECIAVNFIKHKPISSEEWYTICVMFSFLKKCHLNTYS